MKKVFFGILILFIFSFPFFTIKADELDEVTAQLEALKKDLQNKEKTYQQLAQQLTNIKNQFFLLEKEISQKETDVKKGEQALIYQKEILNQRARSFYKNINKQNISLISFLTGDNLSQSVKGFFYQQSLVNQDKDTIIKIVLYIKNLEETKKKLEQEKSRLSYLKQEIDKQSNILNNQIAEARSKIAQLTAKQQELIAKKFASIYIPRSANVSYSCKPDYDPRDGSFREPGFSPRFGFFTFGVPNRVGMNQWGAYGRAKSGQNEEEILRAYYNFDSLETVDTNIKINVQGFGEYSLEDYVKRIYEVPSSWASDGYSALKAQAIAARSYALAYTNNGQGSICATEYCQVFKPDPKGGAWEQAVNDTAGKVMKKDGQIIKAWFSSTHGGYVFSSSEVGWGGTSWTKNAKDATGDINSFSDLFSKAYDRESPIFYCNWGSRSQYNNTAWLKSSEVADIVNALLLAKNDSSTSRYLYQVDAGGDVWNEEKVKQELRKRGITPFNQISNITVSADFNLGKTTSINFFGDGGNVSFDGKEFKDWFNARAPANIQLRGPLYNVEIK
ncbi:MAG: SpoIID/LytB domain-containing protein [Microgenomates group bacterium]